MKRTYHLDATQAPEDHIFVFGSNLGGIHGAGAARAAHQFYEAEYGKGVGASGRSYAIPTKNKDISATLPLFLIENYVKIFVNYTIWVKPEQKFFVTRIGCGLAGLEDKDIAPMFKDAKNCSFAYAWEKYFD